MSDIRVLLYVLKLILDCKKVYIHEAITPNGCQRLFSTNGMIILVVKTVTMIMFQ